MSNDLLGTRSALSTKSGDVAYFSLDRLAEQSGASLERLPFTIKILLENLLRRAGESSVTGEDVISLARWPASEPEASIAFLPSRVLMQDFTGVPAVVDLAALRSAVHRAGGDPASVNPFIPVDLVVDHSVQVDRFGSPEAYGANIEMEYKRNSERYALLNWARHAFDRFRVVPPGMGICHQVNLEYLSQVVRLDDGVALPETLVGTDSHTTMINGLGILAWGVGGIEAEAAMLGQPMFLPPPEVVGIKIEGALPAGTTATDLVLTLTELLRAHGVVGKFVEFFGDGLSNLRVADRATLSNMSPEFGATSSTFPIDANTLQYLADTGRANTVDLAERYSKQQGLFRSDGDPEPMFTETIRLDLASIEPSLAGPSRPQDRVRLAQVPESFAQALRGWMPEPATKEVGRLLAEGGHPAPKELPEETDDAKIQPAEHGARSGAAVGLDEGAASGILGHGSVVIAAITSCTNTSNPSVMIAAGLLARNAVEAGLETKPWVKTSLAPGSRVVTSYLQKGGLLAYLDKLGFNLVGYGCTTCIGNSGPLAEPIAAQVQDQDLAVVAVLSGNRNFEGRIHPQVRASYLASPPLCVAYALAGRIDVDLTTEPIGTNPEGKPVYLLDLWPDSSEIERVMTEAMSSSQFDEEYGSVFEGDERWRSMAAPSGEMFEWDPASSYVREPPFFEDIGTALLLPADITGARALVMLGDSVTTDHISPAGAIRADSPAGRYLEEIGVKPADFNSFGSRRGNHEVMLRGTFGNIRLRNKLAPGTEGPWTTHFPDKQKLSIYEAALKYQAESTPLIAIAGKEYGSGSSRDWAAKGAALLGIKAVLAVSFERIHRSNLLGMGVLPLEFRAGISAESLGITGSELFEIRGLESLEPAGSVTVIAGPDDGPTIQFEALVRIDTGAELTYYLNGGILNMVLRQVLEGGVSEAGAPG
ncbi:MAG: aconitate hydratase AcnA [Actinomycetota bacterium]